MNKYYKLIHNDNAENGPLQLKNISGVDAGFSIVVEGTPSHTPNLEYSLDGTTWTAYDFANLPTITVPAGGQIYLRGTNTSGFNVNNSNYYSISMDQDYDLIGNLISLIDYQNMSTLTSIPQYSFAGLFKNSSHIIHSHQSNLGNSTTTGNYACYSMFEGCSNLLTPVELSKMATPGAYCFHSAYKNCISLMYCPNFESITTVTNHVFNSTFYGCTSIVDGPDFPSLTSVPGHWAFGYTFYGCTSLKTPIKFYKAISPGNETGFACFWQTFYGCTSLIEGVDFRRFTFWGYTGSNQSTWGYMYQNCSSLKKAYFPYIRDFNPSTIQNAFTNWLQNVPSDGTLYLYYDYVIPVSASGVPSNWTVEYY